MPRLPFRASPPPKVPADTTSSSDTGLLGGSPTRVLDFDEGKPKTKASVFLLDPQDLAPPSLTSPRKTKKAVSRMPTLHEGRENLHALPLTMEDIPLPAQPSPSPRKRNLRPRPVVRSNRSPAVQLDVHRRRVEELVEKAHEHARQGREGDAIKLFKIAVTLDRNECAKVKITSKTLASQGKGLQTSMEARFFFDAWYQITSCLASTCMAVALIHYRTSDVLSAQAALTEARQVYTAQRAVPAKQEAATGFLEWIDTVEVRVHQLDRSEAERRERLEDVHLLDAQCRGNIDLSDDDKTEIFRTMQSQLLDLLKLQQENGMLENAPHPQVAECRALLGRTLLELGDREQALAYYESSHDTTVQAFGARHPQTACALVRLAKAHERWRHRKRAVHFYEQAIHLYRRLVGYEHAVALLMNDIALTRVKQRSYGRAMALVESALAETEGTNDGYTRCARAVLLRTLATCQMKTHQYDQAVTSLLKRLEAQRAVRKRFDLANSPGGNLLHISDVADDAAIADSLEHLGNAYVRVGDSDRARIMFREALVIQRQQPGHVGVARVTCSLAEIEHSGGAYNRAEGLYARLLDTLPLGAPGLEYRILSWLGIGNIQFERSRYRDAKKAYQRAFSLCQMDEGMSAVSTRVQNLLFKCNEALLEMRREQALTGEAPRVLVQQ